HVYRYGVYVEEGIAIDRGEVASTVEGVLGDERGWTRGGGVSFRRVERNQDMRIILATPDEVDELCKPLETNGKVSCRQGQDVVLNVDRWRHAFPGWTSTTENYRRMLINHETGHRIGRGHEACAHPGATAAVMQQQTFDLQGCKANWWPLDYEVDPSRFRIAWGAIPLSSVIRGRTLRRPRTSRPRCACPWSLDPPAGPSG
ncbi:MAG: DUF3152 domain-containing protein, partial [Solirubrobacterales bacterium]